MITAQNTDLGTAEKLIKATVNYGHCKQRILRPITLTT